MKMLFSSGGERERGLAGYAYHTVQYGSNPISDEYRIGNIPQMIMPELEVL